MAKKGSYKCVHLGNIWCTHSMSELYRCFLHMVETKDYNIMIDRKNLSDEPIKSTEFSKISKLWEILEESNCQG